MQENDKLKEYLNSMNFAIRVGEAIGTSVSKLDSIKSELENFGLVKRHWNHENFREIQRRHYLASLSLLEKKRKAVSHEVWHMKNNFKRSTLVEYALKQRNRLRNNKSCEDCIHSCEHELYDGGFCCMSWEKVLSDLSAITANKYLRPFGDGYFYQRDSRWNFYHCFEIREIKNHEFSYICPCFEERQLS